MALTKNLTTPDGKTVTYHRVGKIRLSKPGLPSWFVLESYASREAVAQSAQLYRTMQQEKEAGQLVHVLRNGRLMKNTLSWRIAEFLRPGLSERLAIEELKRLIEQGIVLSPTPKSRDVEPGLPVWFAQEVFPDLHRRFI